MFNFRFGTDKIEIDKIWTAKIDGRKFIRTKPKIVRNVNRPLNTLILILILNISHLQYTNYNTSHQTFSVVKNVVSGPVRNVCCFDFVISASQCCFIVIFAESFAVSRHVCE